MMKKVTGILLALVLALALLPTTIWAEGNVAKIGGNEYETLKAAFEAAEDGDTIELLGNTSGDGIVVKSGRNFTVDFGGFTYTMDGSLVGSTGTETQAFQLLKDSTITFKNGKITSNKAKILIQNYSNLTLENMELTAGETCSYVLSNNNGNVVIDNTTITPAAGKVAFDVYGGFGSYSDVTVTVTGDSVINGKVEVDRSNSSNTNKNTLNIESGILNGELAVTENENTKVSITGGSFTDLTNAIKYAADKATIKLAADVNSSMVSVASGKDITLDLGGHKFTSNSYGFLVNGNLTVKNGQIESLKWAFWVQNGAALVIEKDVSVKSTSEVDGEGGGVAVRNNKSSVTVFGKLESVGPAISGIGNEADGGVTINIEEGAVLTSTKGVGIYFPNTTALNIKGGTITGLTGVYVKSGKTTVTGGTIIGTGAKEDYEYNGNGCNTTGDAFVVDKCNYPGGDPVVEIKGGTFKSENAAAVGSYFGNTAEKALAGFITGGSFSSDPTKYAAADYKVTTENGAFTVSKSVPNNNGNTPGTPSTPSTPETFDAGIAAYGVSAVLSVTGMAWMGLKKKSTTYTGKHIEK